MNAPPVYEANSNSKYGTGAAASSSHEPLLNGSTWPGNDGDLEDDFKVCGEISIRMRNSADRTL